MRLIETASFADVRSPAEFGPAPQLQWILIANLVVDDGYQRPPTSKESRKNIRRIAGNFSWLRFAAVVVSPIEGGRYAIIDGQHCVTGAALCGIESVPCLVVLATRREQAESFRAINGNITQVSRQMIFKAALQAGDEEALHVEAVAAAAGVRILFSNRASARQADNETTALAVITRVIKQHGDDVVTMALRCILAATAEGQNVLRALVIEAVAEVLAAHPEWRTHPRLLDVAKEIDFTTSREDAFAQARRKPGTTASLHLQADLTTVLHKLLTSTGERAAA